MCQFFNSHVYELYAQKYEILGIVQLSEKSPRLQDGEDVLLVEDKETHEIKIIMACDKTRYSSPDMEEAQEVTE